MSLVTDQWSDASVLSMSSKAAQTNSGLTSWAQQEKYVHWTTRESPQGQSILCPLKLLRLNHARTVK